MAQELKNSGANLGLGVVGRILIWSPHFLTPGVHTLYHHLPLNMERTEYGSLLDYLVI